MEAVTTLWFWRYKLIFEVKKNDPLQDFGVVSSESQKVKKSKQVKNNKVTSFDENTLRLHEDFYWWIWIHIRQIIKQCWWWRRRTYTVHFPLSPCSCPFSEERHLTYKSFKHTKVSKLMNAAVSAHDTQLSKETACNCMSRHFVTSSLSQKLVICSL